VNAAARGAGGRIRVRSSVRARHAIGVFVAVVVVALAVDVMWTRPRTNVAVHEARIDINAADAAQLCLLPEVGPAVAQRIIDSREAQGPFARVADLRRVKGIGPATLAAVEPHAVCSVSAP